MAITTHVAIAIVIAGQQQGTKAVESAAGGISRYFGTILEPLSQRPEQFSSNVGLIQPTLEHVGPYWGHVGHLGSSQVRFESPLPVQTSLHWWLKFWIVLVPIGGAFFC